MKRYLSLLLLAGCAEVNAPVVDATPPDALVIAAPVRDALMQKLLRDADAAPDADAAAARLDSARALSRATIADLLPEVTLNASGSLNRNPLNTAPYSGTQSISGAFDWVINPFGASAAERGAQAFARKAQADHDASILQLKRAVALSYLQVRAADASSRIAEHTAHSAAETARLSNALAQAGTIDRAASSAAEADDAAARAAIVPLQRAASDTAFAIDTALGYAPGHATALLQAQPAGFGEFPTPAQLVSPPSDRVLAGRPDVVAAQQQLLYTGAVRDVAQAQIFPKISIGALLGLRTNGNGLLQSSNVLGALSAGAAMPLLDFGRIEADVDRRDADTREAKALYEKTVRTALIEVASAIDAYNREYERRIRLDAALRAAQTAQTVAEQRYARGLSSYLQVLAGLRNTDDAQKQIVQCELNLRTALVQLQAATGRF